MGYNAFVACNCYRQGLTSAPPHPAEVDEDDAVVYVVLPPGLLQQDMKRVGEIDRAFDEWKATACPHPDMYVVHERLANMSGMAGFRRLIHERGEAARYPLLTEHLPHGIGGHLPAALAPDLLHELAQLATEPADALAALRQQASQELIYLVGTNDSAVFVYAGDRQHRYELDARGFSIVQQHRTLFGQHYLQERFRSVAFSQQRLGPHRYQFTDAASGQQYQCPVGLGANGTGAAPDASFTVTIETVPVAREYAYILEPLRRLAEAALATGNPICWC